jgi:hypothetical protein
VENVEDALLGSRPDGMDRTRLTRFAAALAEHAAEARTRALDGFDELEECQFSRCLAELVSPGPAEPGLDDPGADELDEHAGKESLGDVRRRGDPAAAERPVAGGGEAQTGPDRVIGPAIQFEAHGGCLRF